MSITRLNAGSVNYVFNGNNAPSIGYTTAVGQSLLWCTGVFMGSTTVATPTEWQLLSPNNHAKQTAIFGKSAAGSDTITGVNWGNQWSWGMVIVLNGALSDITQIVDVSGDQYGNSTKDILGPTVALTPTQDHEYALFLGNRNHQSGHSATFTAPANFTMITQVSNAGGTTGPAMAICEWNQGVATQIPANTLMSGSITEATQPNQGIIIVLKPAPDPIGMQML